MQKSKLNLTSGTITVEINEASQPEYILVLAHGAGAGMNHPFMINIAESISSYVGSVIRFNFPYMEQGRKSPGSPKPNIEAIQKVYEFTGDRFAGLPIFLSGKSYGGRLSSHLIADQPSLSVAGLIYFGFPLHAPGRDSIDRAAHLYHIEIPQLFIQGTRDKLANYEMIQGVIKECRKADLLTIEQGDHSFKVPKKLTGKTPEDIIELISTEANSWILNQI